MMVYITHVMFSNCNFSSLYFGRGVPAPQEYRRPCELG